MLTNTNNIFNGIDLVAGTLLVTDTTGLALGGGSGSVTVSGGTLTGGGTILQATTMKAGTLMAGSLSTMGTMTFDNGLTLTTAGGGHPTWTLKIDGSGDSDCLNFGGNAGSALSVTGTCKLVVTGPPLPETTYPYTIITQDQVSSVNLGNLVIQAPPGFTASLGSVSGYPYGSNWNVTLSFTAPTQWTQSGGTGNWVSTNWSNSYPSNDASLLKGAVAMLGSEGYGTVSLPGSQVTCINTLVIANSSNSYTLSASGSGGSILFSRYAIAQPQVAARLTRARPTWRSSAAAIRSPPTRNWTARWTSRPPVRRQSPSAGT